MSFIGRKLRSKRLLFTDRTFGTIVPIDHGLTTGPIKGIESLDEVASWIGSRDISAVIMHRGTLEKLTLREALPAATGIIVHLNGMTNLSDMADTKCHLTEVDTAVALGADAVSMQVNFTDGNYDHNLIALGEITEKAHGRGLPVLAMLYDKSTSIDDSQRLFKMRSLVRIAMELGCDAVKIPFPQKNDNIQRLLYGVEQDIRIFFAGGEPGQEQSLLDRATVAVASGGSGLCAGRNVFQHEDVPAMLFRLKSSMEKGMESAISLSVKRHNLLKFTETEPQFS